MKKYLLAVLIILSLITSCEQDEICLEEITPKLIIRFYDHENPEKLKKVTNLNVEIEGIEGAYFQTNTTTDSIAIPIKVNADSTKFKLTINKDDGDDTNDNTDVINLNYSREDIFVSRSCGYKTVFHEVNTNLESDTDNWIISIENVKDPQDIIDQNSAHVKILH